MNTPAVSVVMSVYNGADTLPETLRSVLTQEGCEFELVVVDDGSTDGSGDILDEWAARERRLRVIHQENTGLTRALILGCAAARGTYIARIDAGDCMTPHRLERQVRLLSLHPDAVLVTCWTEFCGSRWEPLYTVKQQLPSEAMVSSDHWVADAMPRQAGANLTVGPSHHGSTMFRADAYRAVGGYRPEFYFGQDWDLWYRLAEHGRFAGLNQTLYRARVLPGGISAANKQRQEAHGRCSLGAFVARRAGQDETFWLKQARGLRDGRGLSTVVDQVPGSGDYFVGRLLTQNGDRGCLKYLFRALWKHPVCFRYWYAVLLATRTLLPARGRRS